MTIWEIQVGEQMSWDKCLAESLYMWLFENIRTCTSSYDQIQNNKNNLPQIPKRINSLKNNDKLNKLPCKKMY